MDAKIVKLAGPAEPNIARVIEEFLEEQRTTLAPRTVAKHENVLYLLRSHLNDYGHDSLSRQEAALFDRYYNAEGEEHREFCQLFGPEKIVEELGSFLGYFMVRKVMCGEELKRAAGTVTKKLSKWLAVEGYISEDAGREGADRGAVAARELPRAERAAQMLQDAGDRLGIDPTEVADEDYFEFDHYTIARVGPGRLWLEVWQGAKSRPLGPIPAPKPATELLREGWEVSCSLARVRGTWRMFEVANVYPS